MRNHSFLRLMLLCASFAGVARGADQVIPAPDEKEVEALVADLGSGDFATRKAATERLAQAGPDIVPVLQKYRDNDDPEVRARVGAVIKSFGWMTHGAIVFSVAPQSRAEKLDIRPGDVIAKIDDVPILTHADVGKATPPDKAEYTMHVWRAGRVRTLKVGAGKIGIQLSDWDAAKGGNDQARGFAAYGAKPPDAAEAYRRLRAAREQGMVDPHTLQVLAGLAAHELDRATAAEAYLGYRSGVHESCGLTHDYEGHTLGTLPFQSPHTEWLLGRYRAEPFSPELYHELADWVARSGRNGPMAAELVAKPWPPGDGGHPSHHFYHDLTRMSVWLNERRYDEVLAVWGGRAQPQQLGYDRATMAMQAAARDGRSTAAARIGIDLLTPEWQQSPWDTEGALWGFVTAAAADDAPAADAFLAALDRLSPAALEAVSHLPSAEALHQPAAARRLAAWLAGRPRPAKPGRFEQVALARLVADPASTAEQFTAATAGYKPGGAYLDYEFARLTGLLRFEQYEEAKAAADALVKTSLSVAKIPRTRVQAVAAFAQAHATELAGPWSALRGVVQVVRGRDEKTTWVLRNDGDVFFVDAAGTAKHFEGLDVPPAPVTVGYSHLRVTADTIAVLYPFGRNRMDQSNPSVSDVTYVIDEKRGRWVSLAESDGPLNLGGQNGQESSRAVAARLVAKAYPQLPGGAPRATVVGASGFHWFEGDVLVYVDPKTRQVIDLSAAIAKLARRNVPARVYRIDQPQRPRQPIYSDCGVWIFDPATAKLDRIPLGLADENVMTCPLPDSQYGKQPDGTILVGVSPQQGGAVFRVDLATRAATPTKGFCGLGPDDWYASSARFRTRDDPQAAIHVWYLARLAGKGK